MEDKERKEILKGKEKILKEMPTDKEYLSKLNESIREWISMEEYPKGREEVAWDILIKMSIIYYYASDYTLSRAKERLNRIGTKDLLEHANRYFLDARERFNKNSRAVLLNREIFQEVYNAIRYINPDGIELVPGFCRIIEDLDEAIVRLPKDILSDEIERLSFVKDISKRPMPKNEYWWLYPEEGR